VPDGTWDIVVLKRDGQTNVLLTGQTTRAVPLQFDPGDEIMTLSFKASAVLAFVPASGLLDHGILLPKTSRTFQLAADVFEIPTFDNAESFVQRLVKQGHLAQDEVVEAWLAGQAPAYSLRSLQRRFWHATGMTHTTYRQIQRARQAAALLQQGRPASEVAFATGYADQPHMSRSLKQFLGHTPTEIAALHIL
jgi:AraC-like DNA-binding protein